MTSDEVRTWFGDRGYPLNEGAKLEFKALSKGGESWLFITDNCHDYEGSNEVESYCLDSGCCEPYSGWPRKGFSWSKNKLESLIEVQ